MEDWEIKTGNTLPGIFHGPIKTALNLEKNQEMEVEHKDKNFTFELMPVIESGYINIYGRDITQRRKAEEELKKITEEKNRIESEVKMATLVRKGFYRKRLLMLPVLSLPLKQSRQNSWEEIFTIS